jgi:4-hydroxythreonine-4-phosphate dehydrogenase
MMKRLPLIGVTMGDPVGIGPEIVVKAHHEKRMFKVARPVVLGDKNILFDIIETIKSPLKIREISNPDEYLEGYINLINLSSIKGINFGKPDHETARAAFRYIEEGARLAVYNNISAITTSPINKEAMKLIGFPYPGHTEMLAHFTKSKEYVMMMIGGKIRVSLVTIHIPLKDVTHVLTTERILSTIRITYNALKGYFSIANPKIAVASLNPHAGEGGIFGNEERNIILPAINSCRRDTDIDVYGPLPADSLFYQLKKGFYDAAICMYHDQGLIPVKLLNFHDAVNITLGLPIIRTSVDHGTAYDIAGKGIADPRSLIKAIIIAANIAKGRTRWKKDVRR